MKRITFIVFCLDFFLLSLTSVQAHSLGQPPYFKINNQYANLYIIPSTSLTNFKLPQDGAPDNYLVNQTINFEIDVSKLGVPTEVVNRTKFLWDFGDSTKGTGLTTSHSYPKPGTYFLTVQTMESSSPKPVLLESVFINVVPDRSYKLPQPILSIDGKINRDPLTETLSLPFEKNLNFDGTLTIPGSAPISSFFWDFGDSQTSTETKVSHSFAKDLSQIAVVLRVTDTNGFIVDNYAQIQNQDLGNVNSVGQIVQKTSLPKKASTTSQLPQTIIFLIGLLLVIIVGYTLWQRRKKRT